jgi:hypothetical protein
MTQTVLDTLAAAAALHVLFGLAAGGLLGFMHFATLRRNAALYLARSLVPGVGLHLLRFAILGAALFLLTRLGADALLSGMLGLLAVRHLLLRRTGESP